MKQMGIALLAALLLTGIATACVAEAPVSGRFVGNPRDITNIGDPFVLAEDGYHVYATGAQIGFFHWTSDDLTTFERDKALKKAKWVSGDYWAPEVYPWQGRYVMLFTGRWKQNHSLRIGIAFADRPEGPFEDPLGAPLFDFGYAAIDGTLVLDDEGTPYMIYSRDCSENRDDGRHESHLYGVRLADDLLSTVGEPVLLTTPDTPWETVSGDYRWNEGPAVLRHDGKYYLFYSANYFASRTYSVGVAVADHPLGPYVKQANNPILTWVAGPDGAPLVSGPGHNNYFTVGDELFTAYHTHTDPAAPTGNRQLCVDRAGFHADGTAYIDGPTLAPQLRPLAELGLRNLMAEALCAEDPDGLLRDGDTCLAASSAAYVWQGSEAHFTWAEPVTADMLLLWPALGEPISGTVLLDGRELSFELAPALPGEAAILTFESACVSELVLSISAGRLGEVRLIGPAM